MRWLVSLSKLCTVQLRPHPYWESMLKWAPKINDLFLKRACDGIDCMGYEWIVNHDMDDAMGETWCPTEGTGMCYCCQCP